MQLFEYFKFDIYLYNIRNYGVADLRIALRAANYFLKKTFLFVCPAQNWLKLLKRTYKILIKGYAFSHIKIEIM